MTRALFLFLDGVGLGGDDPAVNPFAAADLPMLTELLGGQRLLSGSAPFEGELATLIALDPAMGVPGTPQSATGQAALLTGKNVSSLVGEHYGPKPNEAVAAILREDNVFRRVLAAGGSAALLNGYPPRYFDGVDSGRRLYSAIPLAVTAAGLDLMTIEDMRKGRAFAADFTGKGWASQPGFPQIPLYEEGEAGAAVARAAAEYSLAWFDYWPSDYVGHRGTLADGVAMLESLDAVLEGLVGAFDRDRDLIVISSDHGNLEDLSRRTHTKNDVPGLIIGADGPRKRIAESLTDLASLAPALRREILED